MSEALVPLAESTRAYLRSALDTEWALRKDPFRESASLEGTWVGAFAQPAVMLNTVSAVELTLDAEGNGSARDEYGVARIVAVLVTPTRFAFEKTYNNETFVYVGGRNGSEVAGYWYSKKIPSFAGIFSMTRSDCVSEKTLSEISASIEKRARPNLTRFFRLLAAPGVVAGVSALAWAIGPIWFLGTWVLLGGFLIRSKRSLASRVDPWRKALE